jgi:CRP-like cAMP-binding protein
MFARQSPSSPQENHLLNALPSNVLQRLAPHLELAPLQMGDVIYESGGTLSHAYFPASAVVSLLHVLEEGASTEFAVVGNEGVLGIALIMGGETMPNRAVVQSAGYAHRLRAQLLKNEFNNCETLEKLLLRYSQFLLTQVGQTAVCNRHHTILERLSRWLLSSLDRLPSNELLVTHEMIANVLGVRREGVTAAVGKLQRRHLIKCGRGHITVIDRGRLEEAACECYGVVKSEQQRLLPGICREPAKEISWFHPIPQARVAA